MRDRFFPASGANPSAAVHLIMGLCLLMGPAGICQIKVDEHPPAGVAVQNADTQSEGLPEGTPLSWARAAAQSALKMNEMQRKAPLRYRQRKVDAKGDATREVIETADGNVARLVEHDGKPITADEDARERARLTSDLQSPDDFNEHQKREEDTRAQVMKVIAMLPDAMIYSYAPGQPQLKVTGGPQVVLDFHPNPQFRPPTILANVLPGLEGRVWIDQRSHFIWRIEANVLHPVNFGLGVVAKIFPGGKVALEQQPATVDRWVYSRIDEDLVVRVLMLRTIPQKGTITSWDFRRMNALLPYQDAIRMLLAMQIPVR